MFVVEVGYPENVLERLIEVMEKDYLGNAKDRLEEVWNSCYIYGEGIEKQIERFNKEIKTNNEEIERSNKEILKIKAYGRDFVLYKMVEKSLDIFNEI